MLIFLTGLVGIKLSPPYSRKLINARQSQELLFGMTPAKGDQKTLVLTRDRSDGGYVVTFPEFPEALTQGNTKIEALENALDCLEEAVAARILDKEDIPKPSPLSKYKQKDRNSNPVCVGLMGRPGGRRKAVKSGCYAKTGIACIKKRHLEEIPGTSVMGMNKCRGNAVPRQLGLGETGIPS